MVGWRVLKRHDGLLAFVCYLAVALIFYRDAVAHMQTVCACSTAHDIGDNADFVWWFGWVPHAILHGGSLLHPNVIWAPSGISMAGTTATLLLAVVAAPLTLLWGPLLSYNVMMILTPVTSAWAAYRLCKYIAGDGWAALLGGFAFGFSSFEIAHLVGHLPVAFVVCVPLIVLCVLRYLDGADSDRRFLTKLTLLLLAQLFISVETLFTFTVLGVLALLAAAVFGSADQRRHLLSAARLIVIAYGITVALSSWYLISVLRVPIYSRNGGLLYPTDVLAFVIPTSNTWLGGARFAAVSAMFPGGPIETNAYLGVPLVLIVCRYLYTRFSRRGSKVLLVMFVATVLWILGTLLYVAGQATIRMPYALLAKLPLFENTLQGRIAMYLSLAATVTLALWLAAPRSPRKALIVKFCGVVAVVAVLPNLLSPSAASVGRWPNPQFFKTAQYKRYLSHGETILPITWGYQSASPMWQAEDGFSYRLASGYWMTAPPASWLNQATQDLWLNTPHAGDAALLREVLIEHNVGAVVVQDDQLAKWAPTLREAGLRVTDSVGGVTIYDVNK